MTRRRPPPPSWPAEAALAGLVMASVAGFGRVLAGGWEVAALAPPAAVLVVAAALRRAAPAAALAGEAAAGILAVPWAALPGTTLDGLPTLVTVRQAGHLLTLVPGQAATLNPPAPPTPALLVAVALAGGIAALAASGLRRVPRTRAAAALPPVAAWTTTGLGSPGGRLASVMIEVLLVAVYLAAVRAGADRDRRLLLHWRAAGATAMLCAATGGAVAALAGPDGGGPLGWLRLGGSTPERVLINPLVELPTRLAPQHSGTVLFTVRASQPSYWQLTTLEDFTGVSWKPGSVTYRGTGSALADRSRPSGGVVRATFHIRRLDSPWLPTPLRPLSVQGAGAVEYSARTASLLSKKPTSNGLTYTVTASDRIHRLTGRALAGAPEPRRGQAPAHSLELPSGFPAPVRRLAERITAGATSEYSKALALQDWLRSARFTYSLHPRADGSGVEALTTFLFDTRTGYCQQFAAAFAAMARSLGLPARLAVGFTTGTPLAPHLYEVTDADVHTWPEVWFPHFGWVPFEPTQGRATSFAIPGTPYTEEPGSGAASTGATAAHRPTAPTHDRASGGLAPPSVVAPVAAGGVAGTLVAGALVAGALLRRRHRRRHRRENAPTGGAGADGAAALPGWERTAGRLRGAGIRAGPGEPLPRFAERAATELAGDQHLRRALASAAEAVDAVRWGDGGVDPDVERALADAESAVARAIEASRSVARRSRSQGPALR